MASRTRGSCLRMRCDIGLASNHEHISIVIDRPLVTTDLICLTMRLESSDLGCGSLVSVGIDLDQAQYKTRPGSEPQSPTVDATKRELYVLAIIDRLTGTPIRVATEQDVSIDLSGFDVDLINRSLINSPTPSKRTSPLTPKGGGGYSGGGFDAFHRQKSLQALLANAKGGPACDHCGVKESPQWRKGPEDKPILCNACGTRYRRTNQFAPLTSKEPECSKKRLFQNMVTVADDKLGNENKAPRILSL